MARTRRGAAPYSTQLKDFLSTVKDSSTTFSAATLERQFDARPNEIRRIRISRICQAVRKAWQDGAIVAFVAPDGTELCEKEFCIDGGAAQQHPQIYGLPGASSPEPGYAPTTHEESLRLKAQANGHPENADGAGLPDDETTAEDGEPVQEDVASAVPADAGGPAAAEPPEPDAGGDSEDGEDLAEVVRRYKPRSPAPKWLPDRLLTHLVMLPSAVSCWREGLDKASKTERLQLIRAGIRRKGPMDAPTASRMVALCRSGREWWSRAFSAAVEQYREWGECVAEDDLARLRRAPVEFLLEQGERYHPVAVLLCGLALGADSESLGLVAEEGQALLDQEEGQQTISVQEELRHRATTAEAEGAELRRQLEDAQDEAKAQRTRADELTEQLKAQDPSSRAGARLAEVQRENRELLAANAELQTRLEGAAERARMLDEARKEIAVLAHDNDELRIRATVSEHEHALREQAEARLQEQIAETRLLERQLQETGGLPGPVENGAVLARALAKPIGEATEHAARRLATGRATEGDAELLRFASAFGELAASLNPPSEAQPQTSPTPKPESEGVSSPMETAQPIEAASMDTTATAPSVERLDESAGEPEPVAEPGERPAPPVRRRSRRTAAFVVHPFGGAGEVGGSAIVVQTRSGHSVLLDAGQRVKGEYGIDTQSPFHHSLPPYDELDAIVVSHAHIDHIGSLPVLYREYQRHREERLPILMSEPTRRVGEIMMRDSAKIQHKREYLTKGAFAELADSDFAPELDLKPAYTEADIVAALDAVEYLEPRQPRTIPGTSLTVKLLPVAHVLGSCAVHLTDNETGTTLL